MTPSTGLMVGGLNALEVVLMPNLSGGGGRGRPADDEPFDVPAALVVVDLFLTGETS